MYSASGRCDLPCLLSNGPTRVRRLFSAQRLCAYWRCVFSRGLPIDLPCTSPSVCLASWRDKPPPDTIIIIVQTKCCTLPSLPQRRVLVLVQFSRIQSCLRLSAAIIDHIPDSLIDTNPETASSSLSRQARNTNSEFILCKNPFDPDSVKRLKEQHLRQCLEHRLHPKHDAAKDRRVPTQPMFHARHTNLWLPLDPSLRHCPCRLAPRQGYDALAARELSAQSQARQS